MPGPLSILNFHHDQPYKEPTIFSIFKMSTQGSEKLGELVKLR